MIFTSGSTGVPKGVLVPNRTVHHLVNRLQEVYGSGPDDRFSKAYNLSFDGSVHDRFTAWNAGGSLYPVPATQLMAPMKFRTCRACLPQLPPLFVSSSNLPCRISRISSRHGTTIWPNGRFEKRFIGRLHLVNTVNTITLLRCSFVCRLPRIGCKLTNTRLQCHGKESSSRHHTTDVTPCSTQERCSTGRMHHSRVPSQ